MTKVMRYCVIFSLLLASSVAVLAYDGSGGSIWAGDYACIAGTIQHDWDPSERYGFIAKGNQVWRFFGGNIQGNEMVSEPTIPQGDVHYSEIRVLKSENSTTPWGTKWNYEVSMNGDDSLSIDFTPTTALNISSYYGQILHHDDGTIMMALSAPVDGTRYGMQGLFANDTFYSLENYGATTYKFEFSTISGGSCYLDSIDLHRSNEGSTWLGQGAGCKFVIVIGDSDARTVLDMSGDDHMMEVAKDTQSLGKKDSGK